MLDFVKWKGNVILAAVIFSASGSSETEIPSEIFRAEYLGDDNWFFDSEYLSEHTFKYEEEINIWEYTEIKLVNGFLPLLLLSKTTPPFGENRSDDYENMKRLFTHCTDAIKSFLNSIQYLGPLRPVPKRIYVLDEDKRQRWKYQGLEGFVRFLQDKLDEDQLNHINAFLKEMGLGESIKSDSIFKEQSIEIAKVRLKETEDHDSLDLIDLGFGTSQVLPIIIQSILARPGDLVILEQPELHLHPRAQAELANLFVTMARKGVHFLIETHSEHLLLRLRRWVVEHTTGKYKLSGSDAYLKWEELLPYFLFRRDAVSIITRLGISPDGEFVNIPDEFDEFFSDDLTESLEIMKLKLSSDD